MSGVKISTLPAADAANDTDQLEVNQGGTSRRVTVGQISSLLTAGGGLFAADGDGAGGGTDLAASLQVLVDAASARGGGENCIPYSGTGIYRWTTQLIMKSNVTVRVAPGVKFDHSATSNACIRFDGAVAATFDTATDRTRGDTTITTTASHTAAVGDIFRIMGQRNALSSDAGDDRCGEGTDGAPKAYFAEWLTVGTVTSSTVFEASDRLIFRDYLINNASETDTPAGRPRTTVEKMNPCRNAHWIGGEFLVIDTAGWVVNASFAVECSFSDAIIRRGTGNSSIIWSHSYRCEARNVKHYSTPKPDWDSADHFTRNSFRCYSSQETGYRDCHIEYNGQSLDFSYSNNQAINVRPYCIGCTIKHGYEGATEHPGVWEGRWIDNRIIDCLDDGILIRGTRSTVHGNLITSSTELLPTGAPGMVSGSSGVMLNDGHARFASIQHNTVRGFRYAFMIANGSNSPGRPIGEASFDRINCLIANNMVSDCYAGLRTNIGSDNYKKSSMRGIVYHANQHWRMGRWVVWFDGLGYAAGSIITDNVLHGPFFNPQTEANVAFVRSENNSPALVITGNAWMRSPADVAEAASTGMISLADVSDVTAFPVATWERRTIVRNNLLHVQNSGVGFVTATATTMVQTAEFADRAALVTASPLNPGPMGLQTGMYTPEITSVSNCTAPTPVDWKWTKVGQHVSVFGLITVTPTTAAIWSFRASIPLASVFAASIDAAGSGTSDGSNDNTRVVAISSTPAVVQFSGTPNATTARNYGFTFSYVIK